MTSFSILDKSFQRGFRPDLLLDGQVTATKAKKACCRWNNKELDRELNASKKALNWLQSNRCDGASATEVKSIFLNVSGRMRYYKKLSSGFWAWLIGIFRCGTTNQQLKKLAETLSSIQRTVINSESFKYSILNQIKSGTAKQDLFKQLQKEFPELVISRKPQARDFGLSASQGTPNVPFLLQKTKNNIQVALPPASHTTAPTILTASNLQELPSLFAVEIEKRFNNSLCAKYGCLPYQIQFDPTSGKNPPVDNVSLFVKRKCCEGKCTLVAEIEHVITRRTRFKYELSIDTNPAVVKAWVDDIVEGNRREMQRIQGLLAQDNLFKVDWSTRKFRADFTTGITFDCVLSDDLSTEAFEKARAIKANLEPNKAYFERIPITNGQRVKQLQGGVTAVVEQEGWRSFKITLNLLPPKAPLVKAISSDQNLERTLEEFLNTECPFWKAAETMGLLFKTPTELETLVKQKSVDLKNDATQIATLRNAAAWEWTEQGLNKCIKVSYWNPQTGLFDFKELLVTETTSDANFKQFLEDLRTESKQKYKTISASQPNIAYFANVSIEPQYDLESAETKCFWKATLTHQDNTTIDVITYPDLTPTSHDRLLQRIQLVETNINYFETLTQLPGDNYRHIVCSEGIICICHEKKGFVIWIKSISDVSVPLGTYNRFERIQEIIASAKLNFSEIIAYDQAFEELRKKKLVGDYQLECIRKRVQDDLLAPIRWLDPDILKNAFIAPTPEEIKAEINKVIRPFLDCAELLCKKDEIEALKSQNDRDNFNATEALKVHLSIVQEDDLLRCEIQHYDLKTRRFYTKKVDLYDASQVKSQIENVLEDNRTYISAIRTDLEYQNYFDLEKNLNILTGKSSVFEFTVPSVKGSEIFRVECNSTYHDFASQQALVLFYEQIKENFDYFQNISIDSPQKTVDFGRVKFIVTHELATDKGPSHYHIEKHVDGACIEIHDLYDMDKMSLEIFIQQSKVV